VVRRSASALRLRRHSSPSTHPHPTPSTPEQSPEPHPHGAAPHPPPSLTARLAAMSEQQLRQHILADRQRLGQMAAQLREASEANARLHAEAQHLQQQLRVANTVAGAPDRSAADNAMQVRAVLMVSGSASVLILALVLV